MTTRASTGSTSPRSLRRSRWQTAVGLVVAIVVAVVAFGVAPATARAQQQTMFPGSNTPLGVWEQQDNFPGWSPPLQAYYYMYSTNIQFPGPTPVWVINTTNPGTPPGAVDPQMGGATVKRIGGGPSPNWGKFAKIRGTNAGWVKVEVHQPQGNVVDEAWYCFYEIKIVEDDVGAPAAGHDPRFGRAGATEFSEEGGYHFSQGMAEPAAEDLEIFDDRYDGELSRWSGAPLASGPRTTREQPEAQLLADETGSGNAIMAGMRDEQYVRVFLHGPREPMISIPIRLTMTPGSGGGEVMPGLPPNKPSYEIEVHDFRPPSPAPGSQSGQWLRPTNPTTFNDPQPLIVEKDSLYDLANSGISNRWLLRIPWRGKNPSNAYNDIEVEARIPNPNSVAQLYGVDQHDLKEGCVQGRLGTVMKVTELGVYAWEPPSYYDLQTKWYRRARYTLHNGTSVTTPKRITIAFGAMVTEGENDREEFLDKLALVETPGPVGPSYRLQESYFEEVTLTLKTDGDSPLRDPGDIHEWTLWTQAKWPQDAVPPWYDTGQSVPTIPESLKLDFRGYLGAIPQSPGAGDFAAEPAESSAESTQAVEQHFLNAIADVTDDGTIDADDDDEATEESDGLIVPARFEAGTPQSGPSPPDDPNLRKLTVWLSDPVNMTYAGVKLDIWSMSFEHDVFLWTDAKRTQLLPREQGGNWLIDLGAAHAQGDKVELWVSCLPSAEDEWLEIGLGVDTAVNANETRYQWIAMDRMMLRPNYNGIDVDSNNDDTVTSADDEIEDDEPGLIVIASNSTSTPTDYDLVIHRAGSWSSGSTASAKLKRAGTGAFEVLNPQGNQVMSASATEATIPNADVFGSGTVTYTIRAADVTTVGGEATLTLEISKDGVANSTDSVEISVFEVDIESIEFASDYQDSSGNPLLKKSPNDNYEDVGVAYEKPEWTNDSTNPDNPAAHKKNTKVQLKVKVKVEPNLQEFKLIGDCTETYLDFESGTLTATGSSQTITITATDPLPNTCIEIAKSIDWTIKLLGDVQEDVDVVTSGAHTIYVTIDTPRATNSYSSTNALTQKRVEVAIEEGGETADVDDIAEAIQQWRDDFGMGPDPSFPNGYDADDIWAVADETNDAQCAEGAILMEQVMRILGIDAEHRHVLASEELPVLYRTATNNVDLITRQHNGETEYLMMWFASAWQLGEGCCLVNGKLYAAFAEQIIGYAGGEVGTVTADTAEHHILLQLKDVYRPTSPLQYWAYYTSTGTIKPSPSGDTVDVPTE